MTRHQPGRCRQRKIAHAGQGRTFRWHTWKCAIAIGFMLQPLACATPTRDSPSAGKEASDTDANADSSRAPKMPWTLGKKYSYTWVLDGLHVADTEFEIVETAAKKGTKKRGYSIQSRLRYESEILKRSLERRFDFDASWKLETILSTDKLIYTTDRRSSKTEKIWKEGSVLVTETTQNEELPTRSEILLPANTYVLPYDGVVVWPMLMARELPIDRSTEVRVAYPAMAIVYEVKIRNRGGDKITLRDGSSVDTVRYGFESKKRVLTGDLWVDAQGRVVRYRQAKLIIDLTSSSSKKK